MNLSRPVSLISLFALAIALTACAGKSGSTHSKYGTGETKDGGIGLGTLRRVHFGFDQSTLSPTERATLDYNINRLENNSAMKLLIEGHTDERGSSEYNIALGERRSKAVLNYLVNAGIARTRLDSKSWGEERPLDPGRSADAYKVNRRAEFIVTAK